MGTRPQNVIRRLCNQAKLITTGKVLDKFLGWNKAGTGRELALLWNYGWGISDTGQREPSLP